MRRKAILAVVLLPLFLLGASPPAQASRPVTVAPVITWGLSQEVVAFSGDLFLYSDDCHADPDLYAYDLSSDDWFPVDTTNGYPPWGRMAGNVAAVWMDDPLHGFWEPDFTGLDIYGLTIDPATRSATRFPVCTASEVQQEAGLSEELVVWADWRDHGAAFDGSGAGWSSEMPADIWAYDRTTGRELPVVRDSVRQEYPAVSGRTVVWQDKRNGGWDIYGATVSADGTVAEFPICRHARAQINPAISGDTVVWTDYRRGNADIYGYDLQERRVFPVRIARRHQMDPQVSGTLVLWNDVRYTRAGVVSVIRGKDLAHGDVFTIPLQPWGWVLDGDRVLVTVQVDEPDPFMWGYFSTDVWLATIGPSTETPAGGEGGQ